MESKAVTVVKHMGASGNMVIGYQDGIVELRNRTMAVEFAIELGAEITDIAAKDHEFFVSLNNGRIFKVDPETQGKIELKGQDGDVDC